MATYPAYCPNCMKKTQHEHSEETPDYPHCCLVCQKRHN